MDIKDYSKEELQRRLAEIFDEEEGIAAAAKTEAEANKAFARAALEVIETKMKTVCAVIDECVDLAEEAGVAFGFHHIYGMGGWYYPTAPVDPTDASDQSGWVSSSQNC